MENQNKNDLINYLLNYAMDCGFGYELIHDTDPDDPSFSMKKRKRMAINMNWHNSDEIPFIIGHEIGHLILGEQGVKYYSSFSGQLSEEKPADLYSLNLIYDYSCNRGDGFTEPGLFMQAYGIPRRMEAATKKLFKENNDLIY